MASGWGRVVKYVNYFLGCDIRTDMTSRHVVFIFYTSRKYFRPICLKKLTSCNISRWKCRFYEVVFFCDMNKYVLTVRPTALLLSGSGLMYCSGRDVYSHQLWRYVLARRCLIMQIIGC